MTSSSNCSSSYFSRNCLSGPHFRISVVDEVLYGFNGKKGKGEIGNEKDMFTKQTLAAYFGVSLSTIHRLTAQGKIETIKVGRSVRITDQAVARFIKSNGSAL